MDLWIQLQMVDAGNLKFLHIPLHAVHQFVIIFLGDVGVFHISLGQFFRKDLEKHIVLVISDGFVDAAFGIGPGRIPHPFVRLCQRPQGTGSAKTE